ncbi:MAG: paraquat-inducible protein A [Candidatus Omnitrophota bacterium]|nr:paraquat-inducible protein A [Candidatus Omnitrophota bacterium]
MGQPAERKRSLTERHPKKSTVPAALLLSTVLLFIGLSLPLLEAKQRFLWKKWESSYSVWAGVQALWHQADYVLAAVLFFFCIVFPLVKLAALAVLWYVKLAEAQRTALLHWLGLLGKWSMLDVFVVAILIVLVKLGPMANVTPQSGVYVFCAAIVASMLTTMHVESLARESFRSP